MTNFEYKGKIYTRGKLRRLSEGYYDQLVKFLKVIMNHKTTIDTSDEYIYNDYDVKMIYKQGNNVYVRKERNGHITTENIDDMDESDLAPICELFREMFIDHNNDD